MTAEGIETVEHMDAMREAGCNHAQGYLLGRPQPILAGGQQTTTFARK
jgi:EAL domain-containing protein (putative c-di-GMP-specific phosphodiesterase class I)